MKNRQKENFCMKVFTRLFAVVLLVGAMCLILPEKQFVQAEEPASTVILNTEVDYKIKRYDNITVYRTKDTDGNFTAPTLTTAELLNVGDVTPGEWLFAGWFTNEDCTIALSTSVVYDEENTDAIDDGPYYAKFVSADVLSVKCQITDDTINSSDSTVLRCISTVDSLKYRSVGMNLVNTTDASEGTANRTTVSKRIYARSDVNIGKYSYSPKALDTESEYFFSATATILKDNFNKGYLVKPYWVTQDGTTVWGVSRYVTVTEAIDKNVVYIPVKMEAAPAEGTELTAVYGETTDAKLVYTGNYDSDTGYAHFKLELDTTTPLPSVTNFKITNDDTTFNYIYRNYRTKYTETEDGDTKDVTWNSVYDTLHSAAEEAYTGDKETFNSKADEYVIATNADFYGFASVVNGGNVFNGCTVYLVCDIDANNGTSIFADDGSVNGSSFKFPGMGGKEDTSIRFNGIFDGQMHTISNIYMPYTTSTYGLFREIASDAILRKFKLTDSYIKGQQRVGSVVGTSYGGTISTVYSDATVITTSGKPNLGGLVGLQYKNDTELKIENCWFAGELSATSTYVGGLLGQLNRGTVTITNSLNTAISSITKDDCGGLIGKVNTNLTATITNSLNSGSITTTGSNGGAIVGNNLGTITATDVYAVGDTDTTVVVGSGTTPEGITVCNATAIAGTKAITASTKTLFSYLTNLSHKAYWAITEESPVLYDFAEEAKDAEGDAITAIAIDMSWYNSTKDSFTLYNVADFYGFAYLSTIESVSGFTGKTIRLANDMIVNDAEIWMASETAPTFTWPGIGTTGTKKFNGIFDGQGHDISGIYYSAKGYAGLFRLAADDATIKNFSLVNSYIYGDGTQVGSIVGDSGANLQSIYSNAIVKSTKQNTGGLVGRVTAGLESHITNCWFNGTVQNTGNGKDFRGTGGLVGRAQGSLFIKHCQNSALVVASDYAYETETETGKVIEPYVGGLVGYSDNKVEMDYCLNTGSVTVNENASGSYGAILGDGTGYIAIKNVHALENTCTVLHQVKDAEEDEEMVPGVEVLEDSNFKSETELTGMAALESIGSMFATKKTEYTYENRWAVVFGGTPILRDFVEYAPLVGETTPDTFVPDTSWYNSSKTTYTLTKTAGTDDDATEVAKINVARLYGLALLSRFADVAGFVDKTIKLTADIDVNPGWVASSEAPDYPWIGIGDYYSYVDDNGATQYEGRPFEGTFNGDGYKISGIYYNTPWDNSKTMSYGGLFRLTAGATISKLSLTNSYFASSYEFLGSITGQSKNTTLTEIYSDAIVSGKRQSIGGLVGRATTGTEMSLCWYNGDVENAGNATSNRGTGGLVGRITDNTSISNCLNTGTVSAEAYVKTESDTDASVRPYVGGLIGYHSAGTLDLSYCLNTGEIRYSDDATLGYGAVIGRVNTELTVNATAVYGTKTSCPTAFSKHSNATITESQVVTIVDGALLGDSAKNTKLFEEANADQWTIVTHSYPVLTCFSELAEPGEDNNLQEAVSEAAKESAIIKQDIITSTIELTDDTNEEAIQLRQGGCYVETENGKYYYQAYLSKYYNSDGDNTTTSNADNEVVIVKYQCDENGTWLEVSRSEALKLYHANDMTYNSKLDCLVVAHANDNINTVSFVDPDNLTVTGNKTITGLAFYNIDYNATYDCYVVLTAGSTVDGVVYGRHLVLLNGDFEVIAEYSDDTNYPEYTKPRNTDLKETATGAQGVACDDKYIYCLFSSTTGASAITVFDWNGQYVTEISFTVNDQEEETISIVDHKIYVTVAGESKLYIIEF